MPRLRAILKDVGAPLAIVGFMAVVGGASLIAWAPDLRAFSVATVLAGSAAIVLALVVSAGSIRTTFTGPRGRYTTLLVVTVLAVGLTGVFANLIAQRLPVRWDLTETQQFTLAPKTKAVLGGLTQQIEVTGFFLSDREDHLTAMRRADDLLFEMGRASSGRVSYRSVDPDLQPSLARRFGVSSFPVLVFDAVDTGVRAASPALPISERDVLTALLAVTRTQLKKVYLLTGHLELDAGDATRRDAFGLATDEIAANGYIVGELNLGQSGSVPDDAAALVVAGPKRDLLPVEQAALAQWLAAGGDAVFLLDPDAPDTFAQLLGAWGVSLGPGAIVEPLNSIVGDPLTVLLQRGQYALDHAIGGGGAISNELDVTYFPEARALGLHEEAVAALDALGQDGVSYTTLAFTSRESWITADPSRPNQRVPNEAGPFAIALALRTPSAAPGARTSIVVIGDSGFASNEHFTAFSNADLMLNAVSWAAGEFELVSLHPNPTTDRPLVVTQWGFDLIRYVAWFLMPAAAAAGAVVAWAVRR